MVYPLIYSTSRSMFDYIWGRVKSLVGANGVGHAQARHWHHRVYGGLVRLSILDLCQLSF